ncbi:MAG: heavy-metal-associated domain-containing protein [Bacteroidaceae bacterium]|nr:heavy-metal-associated domain-containing protein [Bacteroidaceae bacterium]
MSWNNLFSKLTKKAVSDSEAWHFRTSIMCNGCIAKITPILDAAQGITSWSVDLQSPERRLTVIPDGITKEELMSLVRNAGFTIEVI